MFRKIIEFPLVAMIIAIGFFAVATMVAGFITNRIDVGVNSPMALVNAFIVAGSVAGFYWLFCNFVEGQPCRDFASDGWASELAAGTAFGAGLFALVVLVVWRAGAYRIAGTNDVATIWPILAMAITSGVGEEILLRGIIFRFLEKMLGSGIALALSALLFGVLHLGNPNASWTAALAIAVEAGVLLGALYMLTRRLWAAIGMHAGWNFTQGWVFGVPVSGYSDPGLVNGLLTGPEWLTGGAFGLEASLPAMLIATAAGMAILWLARARWHWVVPMWSRLRGVPAGEA